MALPEPVTRKEILLNKAATGSGVIPFSPVTREEMYLEAIAENGGGGDIPSAVPELWDTTKWPNVTGHLQCFYNCNNAANYADIPALWK